MNKKNYKPGSLFNVIKYVIVDVQEKESEFDEKIEELEPGDLLLLVGIEEKYHVAAQEHDQSYIFMINKSGNTFLWPIEDFHYHNSVWKNFEKMCL